MTRPFENSAERYRSLGWSGVLWFPQFAKHPPPTGFTGAAGRVADDEQIARWLRRDPAGNIGLRLPQGVIGIDVDAYGDKSGGMTLDGAQEHLGLLTVTWLTTARDDGVSGIRWYRVPEGRYLDRIPPANSGIEIIQNHHRYAIVPPSIHPDTGSEYRWHDLSGAKSDYPPRPQDLAELPEEWVEFLRRDDDDPRGSFTQGGGGQDEVEILSLRDAKSHGALVKWAAARVENGAPRNDTGRDLALQLRDNGCTLEDAVETWMPVYLARLGMLAAVEGADGEPYTIDEAVRTAQSIFLGGARREPLPQFQRVGTYATGAPADLSRERPESADAEGTIADDRVAMTTDLGNSLRFARLFRDRVRYVHGEDRWLIWDGRCWTPDRTNQVMDLTKGVIDQIRGEADEAPAESDLQGRLAGHAHKSEGLQSRRNMLAGAEAEAGIGITPDRVDSDPNLLCVRNGTIDLRTGELTPQQPEHLISRMCPVSYDPSVWTSPLLDQFCSTFMPDPQELAYLFKSFGYTLLGGNPHRLWYIAIGATTSGKSQFMEAVATALGPYAVPVGTSVFRANQDDKPRPDLIRALPSRLAYAEEASHGWELHTDMVKRLTGGSMVSVRGMRSNTMIERIPSFTPLIVTNEMPRIRGADQAVKRRMIVLKFGHSLDPSQEDPNIKQRFIADEPTRQALLTQLVAGCLRMQEHGYTDVPEGFKLATVEAFNELNHVNDFLQFMRDEQALIEGDDDLPLANCWKHSDLHSRYGDWINAHGDSEDKRTKLGLKDFGKALRVLGWISKPSAGTRWVGKMNPATMIYNPYAPV